MTRIGSPVKGNVAWLEGVTDANCPKRAGVGEAVSENWLSWRRAPGSGRVEHGGNNA
jgi:hypothetical protein